MSNLIIENTKAIAPNPINVMNWVDGIKADNSNSSIDVISDIIQRRIAWLYSGQGAASASPSLIPGLGTAVTISVGVAGIGADVALMLRNFSYMQLSFAYLHDKKINDDDIPESINEDRWIEFLIIMGLFTGIIKPVSEVLKASAVKVTINLCDRLITRELINKLNELVGAYIFTKYGTKRGIIALGRAIPFCVGVGVSAILNYTTMATFGGACRKYYYTKSGDGDYCFVD